MAVKIKKAELKTVIGTRSAIPQNDEPEFAFAGKSNVGKSSLINALLQRKSLARTSSTPGKTQTVNYYSVTAQLSDDADDWRFILVDLPGYGYTKASVGSKAAWGRMVERYLSGSRTLKKVFLLVDIRHRPGSNDILMYDWIRSRGFEPAVIATKLDKIKRNDTAKALLCIREALSMEDTDLLIPVSSSARTGIEEIYRSISDLRRD